MKRRCYPEPWRQAEASHRARKARARVIHRARYARDAFQRARAKEPRLKMRVSQWARRYQNEVARILAG